MELNFKCKNELIPVMFVFLFYVAGICQARTIYVDSDASGNNDGSNWADAYNFLQDGLAAARSGDEIRVAEGIYTPDSNSSDPEGSGGRAAAFRLISGVVISGGYAGFGAPEPNARDIQAYETILSGDLNGNDKEVLEACDLPGEQNRAENSYHVVYGIGVDETAVMDGLTISGGQADYESSGNQHLLAGGMYNEDGSPTLVDCTFKNNLAAWYAGGMYNGGEESAVGLTGCRFVSNYAGFDGGGMFNNNGNPLLTECVFGGNCAGLKGGGMVESGASTLVDCIFTGNSGGLSGGGMATGPHFFIGPATLVNCLFVANSAREKGGAMDNYIAAVFMNNCTFVENSAAAGRAVSCSSYPREPPTYFQAVNCIFRDGGDEVLDGGYSIIHIGYSNVEGGWSGHGNIDSEPLFVDSTAGDYHLCWNSPCIDTGDPGFVGEPNGVDIDGEPRVIGVRVDMGMDEVGPKQADFTRDGIINLEDLCVLGGSWRATAADENWYVLSDLLKDGVIGTSDLGLFVGDWLWQAQWHEIPDADNDRLKTQD
jgi:hypothetical protein